MYLFRAQTTLAPLLEFVFKLIGNVAKQKNASNLTTLLSTMCCKVTGASTEDSDWNSQSWWFLQRMLRTICDLMKNSHPQVLRLFTFLTQSEKLLCFWIHARTIFKLFLLYFANKSLIHLRLNEDNLIQVQINISVFCKIHFLSADYKTLC